MGLIGISSQALYLKAGGDPDIYHRISRVSPTRAGNVPSSPPILSVHVFMTKESYAVVVYLISCVWLFAAPWTAARQTSLSITDSHSLLKLMSIKLVTPSNRLLLCRPLLLPPSIFPSIRVFSKESALPIMWPEYWSFSFSISPSSEHPGLVSFKMDWLDLLAVQGALKSLLSQHHNSKTSFTCFAYSK